ncbi:MAG: hypothetical protein QOF41_2651 [Methylobacteriaceae bacterium]|nr:hypothetical protein [Methylobacteriaceae bacterium]
MKLVRTLLVAAALASLPALALAQGNTALGAASGAAAGGAFAGPAGAFAGGVFGGTAGTAADVAMPSFEGRSVYVQPGPAYVAPGSVYVMPDAGPLQRRCWTNVYGERQCETFR